MKYGLESQIKARLYQAYDMKNLSKRNLTQEEWEEYIHRRRVFVQDMFTIEYYELIKEK